jgi:hypothetical protein
MRSTWKEWERRLAKLEQSRKEILDSRRNWVRFVPVGAAEEANREPGQYLVMDDYEDAHKKTVQVVERITYDRLDIGLCYPHGTWDRTLFERDRKLFERETRGRCPKMIACRVTWKEDPKPRMIPSPTGGAPSAPLPVRPDQTPSGPLPENGPREGESERGCEPGQGTFHKHFRGIS